MKIFHTTMLLFALACIVAGLASCNSLALTGAKKYKTDMNNALTNIDQEISKDGKVSDKSLAALEAKLAAYKTTFGEKPSYKYMVSVVDLIKKAQGDPNQAFSLYQQTSQQIAMILDTLKLEVNE
jgi:hypothetical protein